MTSDPYWLPESGIAPWANLLAWCSLLAVLGAGAVAELREDSETQDTETKEDS